MKDWNARVQSIPARAKAVGMPMVTLCEEAGVARATIDRWRASLPKTIETMHLLETVLARLEKKAEKPKAEKSAVAGAAVKTPRAKPKA